jgi:hypothetical protein
MTYISSVSTTCSSNSVTSQNDFYIQSASVGVQIGCYTNSTYWTYIPDILVQAPIGTTIDGYCGNHTNGGYTPFWSAATGSYNLVQGYGNSNATVTGRCHVFIFGPNVTPVQVVLNFGILSLPSPSYNYPNTSFSVSGFVVGG